MSRMNSEAGTVISMMTMNWNASGKVASPGFAAIDWPTTPTVVTTIVAAVMDMAWAKASRITLR